MVRIPTEPVSLFLGITEDNTFLFYILEQVTGIDLFGFEIHQGPHSHDRTDLFFFLTAGVQDLLGPVIIVPSLGRIELAFFGFNQEVFTF